jgi:hypothetical protein
VIHHRIESAKLRRGYFLDLHYRQGRAEAIRQRGSGSRVPPRYLVPQLGRAGLAFLQQWRARGLDATVRKQMNVAYFLGYLSGWALGANPDRAAPRPAGAGNRYTHPE